MTFATLLAKADEYGLDVSDLCDACCTAGYDNDGSTGHDLFENGFGFAQRVFEYDPKAVVLQEWRDGCVFFLFGKDEADALRRLNEEVKDTLRGLDEGSLALWLSEVEQA